MTWRALAFPILLAAAPAWAQSERDAAEARRAAVEERIDAAAGARAVAKARSAALARDIQALRVEMKRAGAGLRERRRAAALAADAAREAAIAAEAAKAEIGRRRRALAGVLGAMARLSARPPEALAALKDGPADAAKASLALQTILPEVERRIAAARAALDAAAARARALDARQAELRDAVAAVKAERGALDRAVAEKRRLLRGAEAADAALAREVAGFAREAATLDAFFEALRAREAAVAAARAAGAAAVATAPDLTSAHAHALRGRPPALARAAAPSDPSTPPEPAAPAAPAETAQPVEPSETLAAAPAEPPPQRPAQALAAAPLALDGIATGGGASPPVAGRLSARFGQGEGIMSRGWVYAASASAEVFAPYDGRVAYAGPFRGYGNVALIDHGGGYHTLLTGLGAVAVAVGDYVLQGEPLGALPGDSAAGTSGAARPKLYVELRKDGEPVDPAPWFSRPT